MVVDKLNMTAEDISGTSLNELGDVQIRSRSLFIPALVIVRRSLPQCPRPSAARRPLRTARAGNRRQGRHRLRRDDGRSGQHSSAPVPSLLTAITF